MKVEKGKCRGGLQPPRRLQAASTENTPLEITPENEQKIANYLGLAQKAGYIAAGDMLALNAINNGKATLVVIAHDAACDVQEEIISAAEKKALPTLYWRDKVSLGLIIGKSKRGAIALLDEGFAKAICNSCQ